MPGTVGALWGLPLAWGLGRLPVWGQVPLILAIVAVSIPICTRAARRLGKKDPGSIVLDEIASLPITFFLVELRGPVGYVAAVMAAGFVLHRVLDITKPPPARQLERLSDGLGVVADDLAAGVYSCLVLHGVLWLGVFDRLNA